LAALDCIFCKIGNGDISSEKIFEDASVFAIRDISPKGPTHLLVIPYQHVESLVDATDAQHAVAAHCLTVAPQIAAAAGAQSYRLIVNQGLDAGQEVPHFHLHILGGRPLGAMG
jgi:histidine triad (HIT) family protein